MSVDNWVPEQGLVAVPPEERLASDVLVIVLSGPLRVGYVFQVLAVLGVLSFNKVGVNGGQGNCRSRYEEGDLQPQTRGFLSVMFCVLGHFLESLGSGGVTRTISWL